MRAAHISRSRNISAASCCAKAWLQVESQPCSHTFAAANAVAIVQQHIEAATLSRRLSTTPTLQPCIDLRCC